MAVIREMGDGKGKEWLGIGMEGRGHA